MQSERAKQQGEAIEQARRPARPYVWAIVVVSLLILATVLIARPGRDAADNVTAGQSQVESARDPAETARTPAAPDR
jgi:hypothetical protein